MIAFEISVNGTRVCAAGAANSVLSALVSSVDDGSDSVEFNVTALFDQNGTARYLKWDTPVIRLGDEVSIRIIDTESPTPPTGL